MVGFTGLNEAHDPELVQALVASAFDRLSLEVARYEGLIEKFAGDAMLALFGVPQVHEDDAERAVRAGLEMQSAMSELAAEAKAVGRPGLSLRIGIETGEVLVDQTRATEERDRMVIGDPVNTAARLQAAASVGTVVVGPGTYAATRSVIDYEELAPLQLKGKTNPVPAWRAASVKARRGGIRAPLGIESPLVGRESELALLKETVRRMVSEGRPHLVTVFGAAGVGKSRLTWELEKYLDGLPEAYVWRKGRSLAYGQISLGALAEMIRADAGIRDDDAPDEGARKLDARLAELEPGERGAERDILRGVIGVHDVPQVARDELFDALRRYAEALAEVAPAVLVFEDIHWADEGLLDVIESMARWGSGPMLLLGLTRHELLERRPSWAGGIPNATSIVLEPLGLDDNDRLVEGLMPGGIPAELRRRIVELADGNPLFTEELVRMFVDRGVIRFVDGRWQLALAVDELEVPGSVQAVLAARLDALPEHEKRLAQDAAVVGRVFWDAVLAFLAGDPAARIDDLLRRLRVKELVVPREPSSLSGAAEFGFRHVLIRDVAYDSLSKRDRAVKHLSVADWAERNLGDRTEELAELLASHYLSALRHREEFGGQDAELRRLRRQTYRYARLATERAGRLYERAGATRWARVALDIADRLELEPLERARAARAFVAHGIGYWPFDEAERVGTMGLAAIDELADRDAEVTELEATIAGTLAYVLLNLDRVSEGRAVIEERLERLDRDGPSGQRAWLRSRLGWLIWRAVSPAAALPILEEALAESRATGDRRAEAWSLHELGISVGQGGDLGRGASLVRESLGLAREIGDSALITRCHTNLPALLMDHGAPWEEIDQLLREGLETARRGSDRGIEGWILFQLADAADRQGRLAESAEYIRRSAEIARELGDEGWRGRWLALAWNAASRGEWQEADRISEEAGDYAGSEQEHVWRVVWQALNRWRSDPDAAIELMERELPAVQVDRIQGALWLTRMAFRTGRAAALSMARGVLGPAELDGRLHAMLRRWIEALDRPAEEVASALLGPIEEAEALGYRAHLAMLWADHALALARAGEDARDALRKTAEIEAAIGAAPLLGALPEVRWMGGAVEPAATTGT
jgi:class 3 adenylate cyclase